MNGADRRAQAFIDFLEAQRRRECEALLERARADARQVTGAALREAGARVRRAIREERERVAQARTRAEAELGAAERWQRQHKTRALLAAGRERLEAALRERWQSEVGRCDWVRAVLDQALARLPHGQWRIAHPELWTPACSETVDRSLPQLEMTFALDTGISAGLRIGAGAVLVDGSLEGLLADRAGIEGRLLALFEERRGYAGGGT